jgi:hypothetical protein
MSGDGEAFDVRTNARSVLNALKQFDPELRTQVGRELRRSGDAAIGAMTGHLFEPTATQGGDARGRMRRVSRGSRQDVARGLKMRVTLGTRGASMRIVTTRGALRKVMNQDSWRHPVFGKDPWVAQGGTTYFTRGGVEQKQATLDAIQEAMKKAVDAVAAHVDTTTE